MALTFLVTGANGFVGSHLCAHLRAQGHFVREASRSKGFELSPDADFSAFVQGADVVVHLAAKVHVLQAGHGDSAEFARHNVAATRALAEQAAKAGVKRFVFISTIGVHGNGSASPLNEQSPIAPAGAYAQSKWDAEQLLPHIAGIETVILRPPLIYGAGVKANFATLLNAVASSRMLPFGAVRNARDYISVANFCSAIAFCATSPATANQIFVCCDGEAISTPALIRCLAAAMNVRAKLLPIAQSLLQVGAILLRKQALYASVCSSRRIDASKLARLGWSAPQTLQDGLNETANWFSSEQHSR